jgi:hypothetical protein
MYFVSNQEIYYALVLGIKLISKILNGLLWDSKYDMLISLWLTTIFIKGLYQCKIRNQCTMSFVLFLIALLLDWYISLYMIGHCLCIGLLCLSLLCIFKFGEFWCITPTGPYGIGFKEIVLTDSETKPTLSVFYPISREFYEAHLDNDQYTSDWLVRDQFLVGLSIGKFLTFLKIN